MPDLIASETTPQVVDSENEKKNMPLLPNDPILIEVEKATGLRITGGSDFDMPITIFYVKNDSKAKRVGLKLGDSLVMIDGKETNMMTLREANETLLHATKHTRTFKLGVIRFESEQSALSFEEPLVEIIVMEGNPKAPKFKVEQHIEPPRDAYVQRPERQAWHPIMWPHPEYFLPENYHEELPHKRVIRNVRRLLESKPSKLELENLLTALPRGSRPKRNYDEDDD